MLDEAKIEQYRVLSTEIEIEATKILRQYKKLRAEMLGEFWNTTMRFIKIEGDWIYFKGEDYRGFDQTRGRQDEYEMLPVHYLFDPNWVAEVIAEMRPLVEADRIKKEEEATAMLISAENTIRYIRGQFPHLFPENESNQNSQGKPRKLLGLGPL